MLFPTIIVDNFFDNPDFVRDYGLSLSYSKTQKNYPGIRTGQTEDNFFQFATEKMMAILYPMNYTNMVWRANQFFQKISGKDYKNGGWIHQDHNDQLTAIVYLSKHKGCGTSICKPKAFDKAYRDWELAHKSFLNPKVKVEKQLKAHNERFNKTIEIDSMYNRLVMFDASQWHMANSFLDDNLEEERFIMVTFFNTMECNSKILPNQMIRFPLPEMRRT